MRIVDHAKDNGGTNTSLHAANIFDFNRKPGHEAVVALLHKETVDYVDKDSETPLLRSMPLYAAANSGHGAIASMLWSRAPVTEYPR